MRQALAIFMSVIFAFVGFIVGAFVGGHFFAESNTLQIICAVVGALLFGVGTYFYRRDKEQCKKCGALWSVKFSHAEILSQSSVSETKRTGSGYADTNNVLKRNANGDPTKYGIKYDYQTTHYLVGEEKLIYRCNKCGNETSATRTFKKRV